MSTKSTIICGDDFHFYTEMFDEDNVYLELRNGACHCCGGSSAHSLTVIPRAIWEGIRGYKTDLSLAGKTDEELLAITTERVEQRARDWAKYSAEHGTEFEKGTAGALVKWMHSPDQPQEAQIREALALLKIDRDRQTEIRNGAAKFTLGGLTLINVNEGTTEHVGPPQEMEY